MFASLLAISLLPIGILAAKPTNLVVFGDSYSDVGNFQRWTNGPVWSEHVAAGLNASLHSFAYSGAVCDNAFFPNNTNTYYNTPSIQDQVEYYYQQHLNLDPTKTVFAFWVGVNDIHQAFKEQPVTPNFNMISDCIVDQIISAHKILHANKVMLINLPPMEHMPYFKDSVVATGRKEAVNVVNSALKQQVAELNKKYGTLQLDLIDAHSLLSDMVQHPTAFGLTNTDRAYWDDCQGNCGDSGMDKYIWWDRTHLTGGVHRAIGNSILNAGSYAPPTSVSKAQVVKLLLAPESTLRSPVYRAQANTGLIQQLVDDIKPNDEGDYAPIHDNNDDKNRVSQKDQNHSVRRWSPLLVLITVVVGLGVFLWWRKRRSFNHQLLKNEDLA